MTPLVVHVREKLEILERRACRVIGRARSTQRLWLRVKDDEERLKEEIVDIAGRYGRYGYQTVTGLLRLSG